MKSLNLSEENQRIIKEIAIDLKNHLQHKKITVHEFSEQSGLSCYTLNSLLEGTRKILSIAMVIQAYKALNMRCRFIGEVDIHNDPILPCIPPEEEIPKVKDSESIEVTSVPVFDQKGNLLTLDQITASIFKIVIEHDSNYVRLSQQLGIGRSTFYRRLNEWNLSKSRSLRE